MALLVVVWLVNDRNRCVGLEMIEMLNISIYAEPGMCQITSNMESKRRGDLVINKEVQMPGPRDD